MKVVAFFSRSQINIFHLSKKMFSSSLLRLALFCALHCYCLGQMCMHARLNIIGHANADEIK